MKATEGRFSKKEYGILGLIITIGVLMLSCQQTHKEANRMAEKDQILIQDTVVGHAPITDEIAGSAYRKRATQYFVIIGKDTSNYRPIFTENKDDGAVGLDLRTRHLSEPRPYQELLNELGIILSKAAESYNLDSLRGISIGRLVNTGAFAIDITKQYHATFRQGNGIPTADYPRISDFLLKSKLVSEFNNILNKYGTEIDKVSIEKVYFTTFKSVKNSSNVGKDTPNLPEKILDCMTWINVKKTDLVN